MDKTVAMKSNAKSSMIHLVIALCGTFVILLGITMFNQHLLKLFSLPLRMILVIVNQWLLFLVPGILMIVNKEKIRDLGFSKEKLLSQIGIGLLLAFSISLVFTVVPIMLGYKDMVGTTRFTEIWKFVYEFIYAIVGVALAEELVFRGYIFHKLLEIKNSKWFAIILSSLFFGLFHIFHGNILQVIMASFLGVLFCLFREKIKGCTLLSLITTHGVHNALIVLWVSIL